MVTKSGNARGGGGQGGKGHQSKQRDKQDRVTTKVPDFLKLLNLG